MILLLLIPISREILIFRYGMEFEDGLTPEKYLLGEDYYNGLKGKAYERFVVSNDGKFNCYKIFLVSFFYLRITNAGRVMKSKLVKELGKDWGDVRATVTVDVPRRESYFAVIFDDVIVSIIFEEKNLLGYVNPFEEKLIEQNQLPGIDTDDLNELISAWDRYLDKCEGIEGLFVEEYSKRISIYNLQEIKLPDWYKRLGWADKGFMEIIFEDKEGNITGVPEFELPKGKQYKIIRVTKNSELDP